MGRLNRSLSSRYRAARRAGWRRRACEVERAAFHDIGRILVKLSVEHAHAVPNLARGFRARPAGALLDARSQRP